MSGLTSNTELHRIDDLHVHFDSGYRVVINAPGARRIECGRHGLAVLAEFSRPRTLAEALDSLAVGVKGAEDWKELTGTIVALWEVGILRDGMGEPLSPSRAASGYSLAPVHISMLNDRSRTESFLAGIRTVVRPGDIVIEIGTGTGVLAIAAARAGAGHVYAIEESGIGDAARRLFEANDVADRITLVRGRSTEIDLPVRGDVLISEMIGDDPLEERILEVTADAVKRLLKPDARLLPSRIEVSCLPVKIPPAELAKWTFQERTLKEWRSRYGIEFGPLAASAECRPRWILVNPLKARGWNVVSDGVSLVEVDLKNVSGSVFNRTVAVTATTSGVVDGALAYFDAEIAPGIHHSTHPATVGESNHWRSPIWLLSERLSLAVGDRFEIAYQRGVAGSQGISATRLSHQST